MCRDERKFVNRRGEIGGIYRRRRRKCNFFYETPPKEPLVGVFQKKCIKPLPMAVLAVRDGFYKKKKKCKALQYQLYSHCCDSRSCLQCHVPM